MGKNDQAKELETPSKVGGKVRTLNQSRTDKKELKRMTGIHTAKMTMYLAGILTSLFFIVDALINHVNVVVVIAFAFTFVYATMQFHKVVKE
jgi:hypothetical protein